MGVCYAWHSQLKRTSTSLQFSKIGATSQGSCLSSFDIFYRESKWKAATQFYVDAHTKTHSPILLDIDHILKRTRRTCTMRVTTMAILEDKVIKDETNEIWRRNNSGDCRPHKIMGIWSGIGMIRNTNSSIQIDNTTRQKRENTPSFNVENPKSGKTTGTLGSKTNSLISECTRC